MVLLPARRALRGPAPLTQSLRPPPGHASSSTLQVMLMGHCDSYLKDKAMQVTIAFSHFGKGLIQRMPSCRHGYFHVVNNDFTHWGMYAIGGSAKPTINIQENRYLASTNPFAKKETCDF